jgi:hypothetical protein
MKVLIPSTGKYLEIADESISMLMQMIEDQSELSHHREEGEAGTIERVRQRLATITLIGREPDGNEKA